MKYFFSLLLLIASIAFFIGFVKPKYESAKVIRSEVASYSANLETADKLKQSREELIAKYNSIPKADLDNLRTLLPDSVDNIRLIIQIDSLATKNGLSSVRNVDYQTDDKSSSQAQAPDAPRRPYGEFVITFQTVGQYKNLLNFISDLERNLRLVDVMNVDFNAGEPQTGGNSTFKITLKTYWLRQ